MDREPQISVGDDGGQAPEGGVWPAPILPTPPTLSTPSVPPGPPLDGLLGRLLGRCTRRLGWLLAVWLLLAGAAWTFGGALSGSAMAWGLALGALAGLPLAALLLAALVAAPLRAHGRALRAWADHLRRLDRHLERQCRERDGALRAAAARTRFFAAAGHDLRQPLHALSINALALSIRAQRQGDERLSQLAADIERALAQGNSLLDGLLDVSRLDAGAVQPEFGTVDLAALLHGVVAEYAAPAALRGLALRVETSAPPAATLVVRSDAGLLRRVVVNLVVNALKFTDRGEVVLHACAADDGRVALVVQDTGIGIAPEAQRRVFDEFYQVGSATGGRDQGLGLGLAIVRRLCALLDIAVSLASVPGQGTRVTLRLPPARAAERPAGAPAAALPDFPPGLAVLVVDGDAALLRATCELLAQLGFDAHRAAGRDEALAAVAAGLRPRLIVCDARLHLRGPVPGPALIDDLRGLLGPVPALLIGGDGVPDGPPLPAGCRRLGKPLAGAALASALRELAAP